MSTGSIDVMKVPSKFTICSWCNKHPALVRYEGPDSLVFACNDPEHIERGVAWLAERLRGQPA